MKKTVLAVAVGCVLTLTILAFVFLNPFGGSIKTEELLGSWTGSQGAQLTLHEDGTLSAVNIPTEFADVDAIAVRQFSGQGSWSLEEKSTLADQQIDVTLDASDGTRTSVRLRVRGDGVRDGIYIPVSEDSPKKFVFRKS
ncbi:hypothetical protein ACFU7Y_34570 [Kitasatospora sp. NPDC057542]|uniref:hypothetical protein n=1 Tax=Streptomycetaceae TaxID=2062 RepID=UPI001CCFC083|nr:hypothetical protein [Streptomyces sp. LS1784]